MRKSTFTTFLMALGVYAILGLVLWMGLSLVASTGIWPNKVAQATDPTGTLPVDEALLTPTSTWRFAIDHTPAAAQPTYTFVPTWSPTPDRPLPELSPTTPAPSETPTSTQAPDPLPTLAETPTSAWIPYPTPAPLPHFAAGQKVDLADVQMVNAQSGWATGSQKDNRGQHILITRDGGASWQDVSPPQRVWITRYNFAQAFYADAVTAKVSYEDTSGTDHGYPRFIWLTYDGGQTWAPSEPFSTGKVTILHFADSQHGWLQGHRLMGMAMDTYDFFHTRDGGQSWSPWETSLEAASDLSFLNARDGWAEGLLKTHDGGHTWQPEVLPPPAELPDLFRDPDDCDCLISLPTFLPGSSGGPFGALTVRYCYSGDDKKLWLYLTTDGGQSWTPHRLPASAGVVEFVSPTNGWLLGYDSTAWLSGDGAAGDHDVPLYQTQDGGRTWTMVRVFAQAREVVFVDEQTGWVVARADQGSILWRTSDGGRTWIELPSQTGP